MKKREFIRMMSLGTLAITAFPFQNAFAEVFFDENKALVAPFTLPTLPYNVDALEPFIDKQTMEIHHGKHHAAYINNLNKALEGNKDWEGKSIEQIMAMLDEKSPAAIRNNGGGHFNHSFFWEILSPKTEQKPSEKLMKAINQSFGDFDSFKAAFEKAALTRFGSGWAWLCVGADKKLFISSTPNQDNPLMKNLVKEIGVPILGIDVWEHAYYLKYQNKRNEYIASFFKIINWELVSKKFENC